MGKSAQDCASASLEATIPTPADTWAATPAGTWAAGDLVDKETVEPSSPPFLMEQPFTFRVNASSANVNRLKKRLKTEGHVTNGNETVLTQHLQNLTLKARENECEFELLVRKDEGQISLSHDFKTAPLLTRDALEETGLLKEQRRQFGVLGEVLSIHSPENSFIPNDARLYMNTNAPFSMIVCGVQGSGKSHTVSTILENMFIPEDPRLGSLSKALSGLVLHMGDGGEDSLPCEAAWLGALVDEDEDLSLPNVVVYVSPSSVHTMEKVYSRLGDDVTVEPLYFAEEELDAQAFLSMMSVGSSEAAPLYIQIVLSILRELGENYSYPSFKELLDEKRRDFNPAQEAGLKQRMALLESFLYKGKNKARRVANRFKAGQLTVIDLSDPFIDPASASGIFDVVTRLFVRAQVETGKVLLVDEAHKYLKTGLNVSGLTKTLLTLIREQRHKGMRVIISTQEPTVVPPVLLDLCTVAIMHRFSSPNWWKHISQHVSADLSSSDAFDQVVKLQTGEAIILAPSGLYAANGLLTGRKMHNLGRRYVHARIRNRVTRDGGRSLLVV